MTLTQEQQDFQITLASEIGEYAGDPPVVSQVQELPLNKLSWENFEILCCRMVVQEPDIRGTPYRYGIQGNPQLGIDIVATKEVDGHEETWCYQCKRYQEFDLSKLRKAIAELSYEADHYVICISTRATSQMRDEVANHEKKIEIWDAEDLSTKLKPKEAMVTDFFGEEWKKRFCTAEDETSVLGIIVGRVFDGDGHSVETANVKLIIDGRTVKSATTRIDGAFELSVPIQNPKLGIVAEKTVSTNKLSVAKEMSWNDATEKDVLLNLREERTLNGRVMQCGTDIPVKDADITVTFLDELISYHKSDVDGSFRLMVPATEATVNYSLSINAKGFIGNTVDIFGNQRNLNFSLVKECIAQISEKILIITVCDDLRIELVYVSEGSYFSGDSDDPQTHHLPGYYISRFPITCLQYSFYAQFRDLSDKPLGWTSLQSPENREKTPVDGISWVEAAAFCSWLSDMTGCNFGLPTENQWEKAARGVVDARRFPWGDDASDISDKCNSIEKGKRDILAVDTFPKGRSPFGAWDMSGNVWEWTSTEYETDKYYLKGGSCNDTQEDVECHRRIYLSHNTQRPFHGFRVVMVEEE